MRERWTIGALRRLPGLLVGLVGFGFGIALMARSGLGLPAGGGAAGGGAPWPPSQSPPRAPREARLPRRRHDGHRLAVPAHHGPGPRPPRLRHVPRAAPRERGPAGPHARR